MLSTPNRVAALAIGALYIVVGLVGFTATTGVGLFDTTGGLLWWVFEVNPAHNLLHLALGAVLFLAGLIGRVVAQLVNALAGTFLLLLGVAGLFAIGTDFNFLAINAGDNVLHFGTAAILLAVSLAAGKPELPSRKDGARTALAAVP